MATELGQAELIEIYEFALDLGRQAGKILLDGVNARCGAVEGRETKEAEEKMNAVDIVTQTDLGKISPSSFAGIEAHHMYTDAEAFIHKEIQKKYPSHKFIGEETYSKGQSRDYLVTSAPTWIVDPLDGTVNYTHLFPMFCVSIALCFKGRPVIGVIHQPMLDMTYSSCTGYGSWQDDSHPTKKRRQLPYIREPKLALGPEAPKGCIFSCEWGKDRKDVPDGNFSRKIESFMNMASEIGGRGGKGGMVHGVRSLGSATLDLAYVATGAFDIWWEAGCWEWDVAAGIAILNEAGGLVTTANPPEDWETCSIEEAKLGSRLYLAIRPAGDGEGETARQAQERVVREVWKRVRRLDYMRPGAS